MQETILALRKNVAFLKKEAGLLALKGGTEVEDMDFSELSILKEIVDGIVPFYLKIGGVDARNDIRQGISLGVDLLIAPMVESSYALENFVSSFHTIASRNKPKSKITLSINVETCQSIAILDELLASPYMKEISRITLARTDLSSSMKEHIDSPVVTDKIREALTKIAALSITSSIGGGISFANIDTLLCVGSDQINTRHCVIKNLTLQENPHHILREHLQFEKKMCQFFSETSPNKRELYEKRIVSLNKRLHSDILGTTMEQTEYKLSQAL